MLRRGVEAYRKSDAVARYRLVLALSTATMMLLSLPLWLGTGLFPRVPFVPMSTRIGSAVLFPIALGFMIAGGLGGQGRRIFQGLSLSSTALLILQDQERLQPWVYLWLVVTALDASLDVRSFVKAARLWMVGLYVHSGLSKLDASFRDELGIRFVETLLQPFGVDCRGWDETTRTVVVLSLPLIEIALGIGLLIPKLSRFAMVGVQFFHAGLILVLSPLGMNHSLIVLIWNLSLLVQVGLIFKPLPESLNVEGRSRSSRWIFTLLGIGLLAPLTERYGWIDAWPAHALYASHVEKMGVSIHESEVNAFPPSITKHLPAESAAPGPWRLLDLTAWSRSERGVPIYPSNRATLGIAAALANWGGTRRLVKVTEWSSADRRTKIRERNEFVGLDMIRLRSRRFLLNTVPDMLVIPGR